MDGYDFPPLPSDSVLLPDKAVHAMYQHISSEQDKVTLIATGSLTNVALLLTVYPEVRANLSQIVLMGGCLGIGNTGPGALCAVALFCRVSFD